MKRAAARHLDAAGVSPGARCRALHRVHRPAHRDERQACRPGSRAAGNCRRGEPQGDARAGGYVVAPVGRGEIELGIHQVSEILPVKGVKLVGELPRELQKYTVYVAAPLTSAARRPAVEAFIAPLLSPEARARLAAAGYTAPE